MKQEKITRFIKTEDADRKWFVVDAQDQILGRLAASVAHVLRGKHKPIFTPNMDTGDFVVVINADKITMTGKRELQKHISLTRVIRAVSESDLFAEMMEKQPEEVIRKAVKGMLPKNRLGRQLIKKLKVYAGEDHPHAAQKPEKLSF